MEKGMPKTNVRKKTNRPSTLPRNQRLRSKGGNMVGEGTFGCVYQPRFPCTNENDEEAIHHTIKRMSYQGKDTVAKIFRQENDIQEEKESIHNLMRKNVDPKLSFTVPFFGECEPKIPEHESKNCKMEIYDQRKQRQFVYGFGGKPLRIQNYNYDNYPDILERIAYALPKLLHGLKTLWDKKLCHNDLHKGNLLLDPNQKRFNLIDFGKLTDHMSLKVHNRQWYSPQTIVAKRLVQYYLTSQFHALLPMMIKSFREIVPYSLYKDLLIRTSSSSTRRSNELPNIALPYQKSREPFMISVVQDIQQCICKELNDRDVYEALVNNHKYEPMLFKVYAKYAEKQDTYALGMTLYTYLSDLKSPTNPTQLPLYESLVQLALKMCHPNYGVRLHPGNLVVSMRGDITLRPYVDKQPSMKQLSSRKPIKAKTNK